MSFAEDNLPDCTGLPVYVAERTKVEVVNGNIHTVCGLQLFGQTIWQYVVVMTPECYMAARQEYNLATQIIERALSLTH